MLISETFIVQVSRRLDIADEERPKMPPAELSSAQVSAAVASGLEHERVTVDRVAAHPLLEYITFTVCLTDPTPDWRALVREDRE